MTHFTEFAAIDWSGAKGNRHRGIALALCAGGDAAPRLVAAPDGIWSRTAILNWLRARASAPLLVGFDFSFAPPWIERRAYLPGEVTPDTARPFWAHVDAESDDTDLGAASFLENRRGTHFYFGAADGRKADFMHFRRCEAHFNAGGGGKPSTIYDAIGAAQVAKASFAGMRLLHQLDGAVPVWPFDPVPSHGALVVEIYTTIAARAAGLRKGISKLRGPAALDAALTHPAIASQPHELLERYDDHATDAMLTSAWLRSHARDSNLWAPPALTAQIAQSEGWTFGVV